MTAAELKRAEEKAFEAMRDAAVSLADVSIGLRKVRDIEVLRDTYRQAVADHEGAMRARLEAA